MRITHKVDYGVRVMTALAVTETERPGSLVTRETLAQRHDIPPGFLDDILRILRNGGLLRSHRGPEGGWRLARDASTISVAQVIRVLDGPLASVRGVRPHELDTIGLTEPFISLWLAVRVQLRTVLENVTIADLATGKLPSDVAKLVSGPEAWADH